MNTTLPTGSGGITTTLTTSTMNCSTMNVTIHAAPDPEGQPALSASEKAFIEFQFIFCLCVLITGFLGNSLVIATFCKKFSKLKTCEIFMISLALADLIGTLCQPVLIIFNLKSVNYSFFNHFGCQFISWLITTSLTVSAWTLVCIGVDRLIIVHRPFSSRNKPKFWKMAVIILFSWFLCGSVGFVYFFRVKIYPHEKLFRCGSFYASIEEDYIHTAALFGAQVLIPVVLLSIIYWLILKKLKSGERRKLSESGNVRFSETMNQRNRKATTLFLSIVIVFYVLVIPYNIFYLYYTFQVPKYTETLHYIYNCFVLLLLTNSCVNPLIYARLHTSFRKTSLKLLCACCIDKISTYEWRNSMDATVRQRPRAFYIKGLKSYDNGGIIMTPIGTPHAKRISRELTQSTDSNLIQTSPQTSPERPRSRSWLAVQLAVTRRTMRESQSDLLPN